MKTDGLSGFSSCSPASTTGSSGRRSCCAGRAVRAFRVEPPNHFGYVQFPAALLVVFGMMFLAVARNPAAQSQPHPLRHPAQGVLLRHRLRLLVHAGLPLLWKPFAVCDVVFAVLFLRSWQLLDEK